MWGPTRRLGAGGALAMLAEGVARSVANGEGGNVLLLTIVLGGVGIWSLWAG